MIPKNQIIYRVKVGDLVTLTANLFDQNGNAIDTTNTTNYNNAKWKVWKPDGTLIINQVATVVASVNGKVTYTLQVTDTSNAVAGNWEGEVEVYNSSGQLTAGQVDTFTFIIVESY